MRAGALCLVLATGCLRDPAFHCRTDFECGASGTCEPNGYCSVPDASCVGTGRVFSASAGDGLSHTCVPTDNPGPAPDAGVDAPIDAPLPAGCPPGYAAIAGSSHRYRVLSGMDWNRARGDCRAASAAAYLAVPDDAPELASLFTLATAPFWIGIDDMMTEGSFVTQKGVAATFLPWRAGGEPDNGPPAQDCVAAVSATEIATERCGGDRIAICECEP